MSGGGGGGVSGGGSGCVSGCGAGKGRCQVSGVEGSTRYEFLRASFCEIGGISDRESTRWSVDNRMFREMSCGAV